MKKNLLTLIVLSIISCFSISAVWAQTNCDGLDGGVPVGPDPAVFVLGETAAADIAATSIPDAGTTDYTFVVTTPFGTALDADGNPIQAVDADGNPVVDADGNPVFVEGEFIIGVTDDGSFDFNDDGTGTPFQVGVYNFTGFGFNQSELDHSILPDPFAGPNSKKIFHDFEKQAIDFNANHKITQLDRLAISDYLNCCFNIQFENIKNLKSFEVLKQCMV